MWGDTPPHSPHTARMPSEQYRQFHCVRHIHLSNYKKPVSLTREPFEINSTSCYHCPILRALMSIERIMPEVLSGRARERSGGVRTLCGRWSRGRHCRGRRRRSRRNRLGLKIGWKRWHRPVATQDVGMGNRELLANQRAVETSSMKI